MPSTVVRTFTYDPDAKELEITFVSGRRYAYHDVPPSLFDEMRRAFSKGAFFNRRIRDRFSCTPAS